MRFIFDQVRNLALIGLVFASGLWFLTKETGGYEDWLTSMMGYILLAFMVFLNAVNLWHAMYRLDEPALTRAIEIGIQVAIVLVTVAVVVGAMKFRAPPLVWV